MEETVQDNKPAHSAAVVRNITERKQDEQALAAELRCGEQDRSSFFKLSPDLLCIAGFDGYFKQLNPAWEKTLGYSAHELLAKPYLEFVHPEDRAATLAEAQRLLQGGCTRGFENRFGCRDGSYRWFSWNACSCGDQGLVYAVARDITDAKSAEERLQMAYAELARSEESLRKALRDLKHSHHELNTAQMYLIQAVKMELVGTLAAGVAHEVKNPLQIILMGLRFLTDQLPRDHDTANTLQAKMVLQDMRSAVTRANTIIRGLLDFSASSRLELKEDSLNAIIEESLRLMNYELSRNQTFVQKDLSPALPPLLLDRIKMEQVFVNIFMNAVHAMPKGGGQITVRTSLTRLAQAYCLVGERSLVAFQAGEQVVMAVVDDTGSGIPADKIAKVFDPFFTTKPAGQGSGLGLTVVKNIVALHGGAIEIQNRPEKGVRVTILLKTNASVSEATEFAKEVAL